MKNIPTFLRYLRSITHDVKNIKERILNIESVFDDIAHDCGSGIDKDLVASLHTLEFHLSEFQEKIDAMRHTIYIDLYNQGPPNQDATFPPVRKDEGIL